MTKINQEALEGFILNGSSHSYRSLREHYQADQTQAMQIDRTLQKLRRKGKIEMKRKGRDVTWIAIPQTAAAQAA